ncbi:MAG: Fic family protein [Candidatus Omnitrophica bacterium]|nr:Fic family protein [Candidatus Omnitrophota bacterium]
MMTLRQLSAKPKAIPTSASWYLADLGEARGKQELFTRQSPQKLKILREHALIESAVSSNRIEGVLVDKRRVGTLVFGKPLLRDRNEEEIRGYRDALNLLHEQGVRLPVSEATIRKLHRLSRGEIWDAGRYREKDTDIIERSPDGRHRVRFKTVSAAKTPEAMRELVALWDRSQEEGWVHALIALAAFNLDFLCIHPFRDGNGRVSRLLLLQQCYRLGYEAGRYISLERLIEQNKDRYYETLEESSRRWHEGKHDPWPYINYLLFILKTAYREFEQRASRIPEPRGAKTGMVEAAVEKFHRDFTLSQLEQACLGVSPAMVRRVLRRLQKSGRVEALGRGPGALWRRKGTASKRG